MCLLEGRVETTTVNQTIDGDAPRAGLAQYRKWARAFHKDESGLNIIEIILIIFVAVVILIALGEYFKVGIWEKVKKSIDDLMGTSF
jgi:uncharacterized membrane protein